MMDAINRDRRVLFDLLVEAVREADRAYGRMLACSGSSEGTPQGKLLEDGMAHVAVARRLMTEALCAIEGVPTCTARDGGAGRIGGSRVTVLMEDANSLGEKSGSA
jgi:hypothetical protein